MHSDPIADLLTRIRNGFSAKKKSVEVPHSKLKEEVARLLKEEGVIADYSVIKESKFPEIRILLKYNSQRKPMVHELKRISKPGLRVYKSADEVTPVRSGIGTQILSTNQGLMTDREARKRKIGGEVICEFW